MDPVPITPDQVHLWYALPDQIDSAGRMAECRRLLSSEELARLERFRREKDRHLFLVAHALLRVVLSRYAAVRPPDWEFAVADWGKPMLAGPAGAPPLRFNLSHTRGLAAVAVTLGHEIGVDVEHVGRRISDELARSVLADWERLQWEQSPSAARAATFLQFWTLKESYLKARGTGVMERLPDVGFELRTGEAPRVRFAESLHESAADWQFWQDVRHPRHRAAVAAFCPQRVPLSLRVFDLDLTDSASVFL